MSVVRKNQSQANENLRNDEPLSFHLLFLFCALRCKHWINKHLFRGGKKSNVRVAVPRLFFWPKIIGCGYWAEIGGVLPCLELMGLAHGLRGLFGSRQRRTQGWAPTGPPSGQAFGSSRLVVTRLYGPRADPTRQGHTGMVGRGPSVSAGLGLTEAKRQI